MVTKAFTSLFAISTILGLVIISPISKYALLAGAAVFQLLVLAVCTNLLFGAKSYTKLKQIAKLKINKMSLCFRYFLG